MPQPGTAFVVEKKLGCPRQDPLIATSSRARIDMKAGTGILPCTLFDARSGIRRICSTTGRECVQCQQDHVVVHSVASSWTKDDQRPEADQRALHEIYTRIKTAGVFLHVGQELPHMGDYEWQLIDVISKDPHCDFERMRTASLVLEEPTCQTTGRDVVPGVRERTYTWYVTFRDAEGDIARFRFVQNEALKVTCSVTRVA